MKRRMLYSMLIVLVALASIGGATLAWFTATADPIVNEFTAGTVMISADEVVTSDSSMTNVNPGDTFEKKFTIENTGSKGIVLRMLLEEGWVFDWEHLWTNWDALGFADPHGTRPLDSETSYADAILANLELDATWISFKAYVEGLDNPVNWDEASGIEELLIAADWEYDDDTEYWYYQGAMLAAADVLVFSFDVIFDGDDMTNPFQGVDYTLSITFEAIQASNNASGSAWLVNSLYDPAEELAVNWDGFDI